MKKKKRKGKEGRSTCTAMEKCPRYPRKGKKEQRMGITGRVYFSIKMLKYAEITSKSIHKR